MVEIIKDGPFKGLKKNHYKVILADPPWHFKVRSDKGLDRSADMHYETMTFPQIMDLPVQDLAAPDCALFLWITDPMLFKGMNLMRRWGFKYKTVGFYWVKLNKGNGKPFTGMGFWTRANPEQVLTNLDDDSQLLLGSHGKPKRMSASVPKLIMAPRREHSRKPDEIFTSIEELLGDVPRVELFARESREGWDSWGNEQNKFDRFKDLEFDEDDPLGA
jgi:N6-adenosine-specific RNA methylase IME4